MKVPHRPSYKDLAEGCPPLYTGAAVRPLVGLAAEDGSAACVSASCILASAF